MRKGYVTSNPAAVARRPRKAVAEVKDDANEETGALRADEVLSSDEIARLIEHAEPGLWKTYVATAAATGLRLRKSMHCNGPISSSTPVSCTSGAA